MAHFSFYRFWSLLSFSIKDNFYERKKWYLLFCVVVIVGLIFGMLIGIKTAGDASLDKLPDNIIADFLRGNCGLVSVVFARIFTILGLVVAILFCNINRFLSFLAFAILLHQSFCISITSAFLISLFGFGGVLNVIVVILPTKLLFLLGLILLSVISCEHTWRNYRSGGSIFCYEFFACQKSSFLCIGILLLVSIVLELILLPWLSTLLILAN